MRTQTLLRAYIIFMFFMGISLSPPLLSQWKKEVVGDGARASIALDPQGNIHLCYLTEPWEGNLVYARQGPDQWIKETLVHSGIINQCAIVAENDSLIHIAYVEVDWDEGERYLKYLKKEGGDGLHL